MKKSSKTINAAAGILFLSILVLTACGSSSANNNSSTSSSSTSAVEVVDCSTVTPAAAVSITNTQVFSPSSTAISAGGVVKWTNNDSIKHTVTSGTSAAPEGKFDSPLAASASLCLKFNTAGTYKYYCSIHPFMTGVVTAQ